MKPQMLASAVFVFLAWFGFGAAVWNLLLHPDAHLLAKLFISVFAPVVVAGTVIALGGVFWFATVLLDGLIRDAREAMDDARRARKQEQQ